MESPGGNRACTPTKKRKRTPSISPRRGKRKLSLTEIRKHVNSPTATQVTKRRSDPGPSHASSSVTAPNTIKAFFAKAKPPQYTTCPVCQQKVKLSEINRHLDSGCLSLGSSPSSSVQRTINSPENARKIADVRTEAKDRRTRRRLQDKFENSPIYKPSSSSSSSEECQTQSAEPSRLSESTQMSGKKYQEDSLVLEESGGYSNCAPDDEVIQSKVDVEKVSDVDRPSGRAKLSLKKIKEGRNKIPSPEKCVHSAKNKLKKALVNSKGHSEKNTSPYFNSEHSEASSTEYLRGVKVEEVSGKNLYSNMSDSDDGLPEIPVRMPEKNSGGSILKTGSLSKTSISTNSTTSSTTEPHPTDYRNCGSPLVSKDKTFSGNTGSPTKIYGSPNFSAKLTLPATPPKSNVLSSPARSNGVGLSPARSSALGVSPARSVAFGASPVRSQTLGSPHKPREPYYMVNFKLILNAVLRNEFDAHLFNTEDHEHIANFNSISGPAQQLYVRLFQRKYTWFRVAKLEYPRIAQDLRPLVNELITAKLVITELALNDLSVTLKLLMAPDLKQVAKELKIGGGGAGGGGGMQKQDLIIAILKYSSSQRSMFTSNMNGIVQRKAKKLLGHCVKLTAEPRTVFNRIITLFSLVRQDLMDEEKGSAGQSALYTELLVNMGKMSYPVYTVYRTRSFFATREDFLRYEVAMQYESDIADALAINDFDMADRLQAAAMEASREMDEEEKQHTMRHDESLPEFIRCFTSGWIYTRIGYQGVDIRQKQRRYWDAVAMLRALLKQTTFCPDRRGGWWDRLALNLDQHCKKPDVALDCIKEGLADPYIRTGHRLALQQRAQKILKSKKKCLAERATEFQFDDIMEIPKVTIKGTVLPHHGPGVRNTFISSYQGVSETDEGIVVCSVEQVALEHYKQLGYTEGIHGEGTTYSTLIFILFWDIVFQPDIPDVFCYPYQSAPLDLRTDHFYSNRYDAIQQRLGVISEADSAQLDAMLQAHWLEYEGDLCIGVSWDLFRDLQHAKGLLSCIGGRVLSKMAERFLQDHRHCRAGVPDLTMWNPDKKTFRVVEVKGPGDRLAQKQILWLDFFLRLGVDAEVCHVEAVGSKRLKKKVFDSQEAASCSSSSQETSSSQMTGSTQEIGSSQESRTSQETASSQETTVGQETRSGQKARPRSSKLSRPRKVKD